MMTLVVYDIVDDRIRYRIAEALKDYGLERIQYSAFTGRLNHNKREELNQRLRRTLGLEEGDIRIYVICEKDLRLKKEIINECADKDAAEGD
mgnify:CR=1 FL=1